MKNSGRLSEKRLTEKKHKCLAESAREHVSKFKIGLYTRVYIQLITSIMRASARLLHSILNNRTFYWAYALQTALLRNFCWSDAQTKA